MTSAGPEPGGSDDRRWYNLPPEEALRQLATQFDGLDDQEVARRLNEHGPNRIREQEGVSPWRILLDQIADPLIYVLIAAFVVTIGIGNFADAIVIAAVLMINTTVGFIQEFRAESAVRSLMEMVAPRSWVRRSGSRRQVAAEELVPGDVVLLDQGSVVPADLRLLEVQALQVNEAALTGESVPANKNTTALDAQEELVPADQTCMAFMGTAVTSGEGVGVVVATGPATQIGQIAEQVQEAGTVETPLQARIDQLAKWIAWAILGVAALAFAIGLTMGYDLQEMLLLAVALAVAAIPAGLPVVVTVALAVGVRRMARRHAVIRNLPAVDTLGSCTVIVSDKTGTLTQNRMAVRAIVAADDRFELSRRGEDAGSPIERGGEKVDPSQVPALYETLLAGVLCNEAELSEDEDRGRGDPMEVALLAVGREANMRREELGERYPRQEKVPFRTEQKFMATIHADEESEQRPLVLVKGAPERLVQMCDRRRTAADEEEALDEEAVLRQSEALAQEGLRVLAMAVGHGETAAEEIRGDDPRGLVFVGMQGLLDPPRDSAVEAVDRCHDAGIRVIMVTGDHATTAAAIGEDVHVGAPGEPSSNGEQDVEARRGPDIAELSDEELDEVVSTIDVFARVAPGQKLRLVERLQAKGEIVAVTGDGVNDAPALEAAHIGAAMGSGTDVAKEASDMVITDDNFASVYAAVEEGRTAFRNIRMATFFLLSTGAADILIILVALGLIWPLPLLPAQILWVNVVTNGIADVALAFEPGERSLFRRAPRPTGEGVLNRLLIERVVIVGLWLSAGTLAVFWWHWGGDPDSVGIARTAAVTTLVLFQKVHVFNCRSEYTSVFAKSLLANKVLFVGVLASLAVHVGALYLPVTQRLLRFEPLDLGTWAAAALVASTAILVNEAHKRLRSSGARS